MKPALPPDAAFRDAAAPRTAARRATCEEARTTCEPAQAFTVVEVEDQTANAGLRSGDNLSVTIHVPNVDRDLEVGLILRTQEQSRVDFANAQWQGMEHDGNGFRELRSGGHGAIVTFTGLDSSVTLSAVAGASPSACARRHGNRHARAAGAGVRSGGPEQQRTR